MKITNTHCEIVCERFYKNILYVPKTQNAKQVKINTFRNMLIISGHFHNKIYFPIKIDKYSILSYQCS